MKKIILIILALMISAIWADNYNSSTEGTYGSGTAYFSPAVDSSWWLFAYPNSGNYYDTVKGYTLGNYQYIDSVDLDSIGVHLLKIYGFTAGAYSDSIMGIWEHRSANITVAEIADGVWNEDTTGHNTANSYSEMLEDTIHYQGSAAGITAQSVYDKFIEGTNEQVFWGTGSGSGTESCTLYVFDQDTSIVPNCDVYGYTNGTGTQIAYGNTAATGKVVFNLNVGAVDIRAGTLPGYVFTSNYDKTITKDSTYTIYCTKLSPAAPTPGFTTVSFYTNNPGYDTLDASFTYQLVDSLGKAFDEGDLITFGSGSNTMILSRFASTITSDSSIFSLNLLPSPNIVVNGDSSEVWYRFKVKLENGLNYQRDTCTVSGSTLNPFEQ